MPYCEKHQLDHAWPDCPTCIVESLPRPRQKTTLNDIPREDLISMLKNAAWYSGGRECYEDHQGYSYDVNEETSLRDVIYRDEPLFKTPEEAIIAHWERHYKKKA